MPEFKRAAPADAKDNVVVVKIFKLRDGTACVVSWPLPEPGLRSFNPTPSDPETVAHALPYAQFLQKHLGAAHVAVDMEDGVEWNDNWGRLID